MISRQTNPISSVSPVRLTDKEELPYWLALRMVPGLGARRSVPLVERFRSVTGVFRASRSELEAHGLPGSVAQTIASGCTFDDAAEQQRLMERAGSVIIPFQDPRYPPLLKNIYDPPMLLFARGQIELLQKYSIGVVGTRRPTPYGLAAAERLAAELAQSGLAITSGMARGIDTAAHKAALSVNGTTIAVFGSGVDHIYPAENRKLAEELSLKGLLLSEYPMGTPGQPQNFPVRNRIISGMSVGILVVEGAQYSGSAITATLAMEQGREVFAVPGNITSKMSWAPNLLIKQGAKLVQAAEDVLAELDPSVRRSLTIPGANSTNEPNSAVDALGPNAATAGRILDVLRVEEGLHMDDVIEQIPESSPSELIATLFEMQLLGMVRPLPGKKFAKAWTGAV